MKRTIYQFVFLLGLTVSILMPSCKKDLTTYDTNKIAGVQIDTTGIASLSVFQFGELKVAPNLKLDDGIKESDLSYKWEMNVAPNSLDYETISTSKNLDYVVGRIPTNANAYHQILYTVTDNRTGLQYIMPWLLTIRNSFGEGLVVAESYDGTSSDLSHIMSPLVTPDFATESIKRKVYSTVNDNTIPGIVRQLKFTKMTAGSGEIMMGITDNSIFSVKTLNYALDKRDGDFFYAPKTTYKPRMLGTLVQGDVLVENNQLYGVWLEISKFGVPFDSKFSVPDHVALNSNGDYPISVQFYDETNGKLVYQQSIQSFGDRKMYAYASTSTGPFNGGSLPNKVNLKAGVGTDGDFLHVLKDKTSGNVGLYVTSSGSYDENYNLLPPVPKAFYDLSTAPEIAQAKHFVLLDNQKVMYYATATKIYAVLFGTSTATFSERYTAPAGEEITTLQIYQQADYPRRYLDGTNPYLPTNNNQLIMSTYKGTEGKVYLLPMINQGIGNIDLANIKSFGGFGKVSAIGVQK